MRKKWTCICMAALLALSVLSGCSASAKTETETESSIEKTEEGTEAAGTEGSEAETEAVGTEGAKAETESAGTESAEAETESAGTETVTGKHHVTITVKDYGEIAVELYGDEAPITVANFLKLAGDGFYDGLTFHRIISGFMIQGGDPLGTGMGGADEEIKGEFANNGVENPLSHTRGAISMARSQKMDSASSQFFIVHEDSQFLDGDYACFGYVTEGMEVVDAICKDTQVEDNNGTVAKENQPVIEKIQVVD